MQLGWYNSNTPHTNKIRVPYPDISEADETGAGHVLGMSLQGTHEQVQTQRSNHG